ncbi:MAG: hypothetical protein AAGC73_06655, partial [Verrucomicrobiota bacterium]
KVFLELGPDRLEKGTEYTLIYNRSYTGIEITHYIDMETALEKKRVATISAEDEEIEVAILYTGVDEAAKYLFPVGYEVFLNDELYYSVEFETFEFNIGLASFIFEPR